MPNGRVAVAKVEFWMREAISEARLASSAAKGRLRARNVRTADGDGRVGEGARLCLNECKSHREALYCVNG
jgi:hypothetical protein